LFEFVLSSLVQARVRRFDGISRWCISKPFALVDPDGAEDGDAEDGGAEDGGAEDIVEDEAVEEVSRMLV
jgi:hypothetical protein